MGGEKTNGRLPVFVLTIIRAYLTLLEKLK
jgi:hypothetical protein